MTRAFSVIAATIYGNRGAEAMLETVVGRLRERLPGCRFHVFSYYPADDRRILKASDVELHNGTPVGIVLLLHLCLLFGGLRLIFGRRVLRFAPRPIRAIATSEALIDLAGVSFIDGREKFLPFNLLTLLPAWLLGTPIIKMPQAMGPFRSPLNRLAASFMLPRCAWVWARGSRTLEYLQDSGIQLRHGLADDLAFNFRPEYTLSEEAGPELGSCLARLEALRAAGEFRGVIGICPSSVVAARFRGINAGYEKTLADLIRELIGRGFLIVVFPNATRAERGNVERNNDLPTIRRVLSHLTGRSAHSVATFDVDMNAAAVRRVITETDVVLVSRFHALIGALSLGTPPVVLGWSHKYAEVMARFGLAQFAVDFNNLDAMELLNHVISVFDRQTEIRALIMDRLPDVMASAAKPLDELAAWSEGSKIA